LNDDAYLREEAKEFKRKNKPDAKKFKTIQEYAKALDDYNQEFIRVENDCILHLMKKYPDHEWGEYTDRDHDVRLIADTFINEIVDPNER
jgi:hypothetical protein